MGASHWIAALVYSGATRRLRVPWRVLIFTVIFIAASLLMRFVRLVLAGKSRPDFSSTTIVSEPFFLLYRVTGVLALAFATSVVLRTIEKKHWSDLGLAVSSRAIGELAKGACLVALVMTVGFLVLVAGGFAHVTGFALDPATLRFAFIQVLPVTLLVGVYEEILFRGYAFQALCEGIGKRGATIAVAVLFGAAHYPNPNATLLTATATALWSIILCLLLLRSKSLWCCIGFHFAGNLAQGFIFNSFVSGTAFTASLLHVRYSGPDWMTGRPGGLEAALPVLLAACISIAWISLGSWWHPSIGAKLLFDPNTTPVEKNQKHAVCGAGNP